MTKEELSEKLKKQLEEMKQKHIHDFGNSGQCMCGEHRPPPTR